MNNVKNSESGRRALAIPIWENEGGALPVGAIDHHYGRRVEMDRSWTVYHVFTGAPAHIEGVAMSGLTRSSATSMMLSLNRRNVLLRRERNLLWRFLSTSPEAASPP